VLDGVLALLVVVNVRSTRVGEFGYYSNKMLFRKEVLTAREKPSLGLGAYFANTCHLSAVW
jgi:hypothetical protein